MKIKGIKKVKKGLADGTIREYHSSRATGVVFWRSDSGVKPGSSEYLAAFAITVSCPVPVVPAGPTISGLLQDFFASRLWTEKLSESTKRTYSFGLRDVEDQWGDAPLVTLESPAFRDAFLTWAEEMWSGQAIDHRLRPFRRVLSWSVDRKKIKVNVLLGTKLYYEHFDRSQIIWLQDEIDEFCDTADPELADAVRLMSETALRPGDLVSMTRKHVNATPGGERTIALRTRKSRGKRRVQIPVLPASGRIIDAVPDDRLLILRPPTVARWTVQHLSQSVTRHLDRIGLRHGRNGRLGEYEEGARKGQKINLTLYDLRGTACTRLVASGLTIDQLALHMGWQPSYACVMLNHYLSLDLAHSDAMIARVRGEIAAHEAEMRGKAA
jgi:integrase